MKGTLWLHRADASPQPSNGQVVATTMPAGPADSCIVWTETMESSLPGFTSHEDAAWRGLVSVRFKLFAHLERELQKRSGLSDADFSVLFRLWEAPDGRLRLGELGEQLDWAKSRLSKQISRMASRGLVIRETCITDARGAFAALTPAGREAIEAASPPHLLDVRHWFIDALTDEQIDSLAMASAAILARLPKSP